MRRAVSTEFIRASTATSALGFTQGADLAAVFGQDESGIGTILELITTQANLAQARQERVEALTTWRYDRLALGAALGRLRPSDL